MEWLRIGELARRTGLTQRTLRHYDEIGLLVPSGRSGADYRMYSRADAERLLAIQHLKSLGLTLAEIVAALDDDSLDAAALLGRHAEAIERRIADEQELLTRLRRLQRAAQAGWDEVLTSIALSERLRHPDPTVRFGATLGGAASMPAEELIELLLDPDPAVREGAAWAVTQRPGLRPRLVERLRDGDAHARHALAHVLGKLREPEALPVLTDLLADQDAGVAAKAAFGLGQLGSGSASEALVAALGDPRAAVREQASASLSSLPGATEALTTALTSPSPAVREHAADALALRGDPEAAGPLAALLADQEPAVRLAALSALGHLPGEAAKPAIGTALSSPDPHLATLARRLLADPQAEADPRSASSRNAS